MKTSAILTGAAMACLAAFSVSPAIANETAIDLSPFPAVGEGQTRHVIQLPAETDEDLLKVEIIVGRTMIIDCNRHAFVGRLEERTAEGWGYPYYVLDSLGHGITTLMACPPGSEHEDFVRSADETVVHYNSRLPLVVYAPSDVEVLYRVWRAGDIQGVE